MKYIVDLKRFKPGNCHCCPEMDICIREEWSCPLFKAVPVKRLTSAKQFHEQFKKGKIFVEDKDNGKD